MTAVKRKSIKGNIKSNIMVEIKYFFINYMQQPVMRVIDYISELLIGVLTADYTQPSDANRP